MQKKLIIIGIIVSLILIFVSIFILDKNIDLISRISQSILKQENDQIIEKSITYQIYHYSEDKGKMLITFQDDTNGIDRIEDLNGENIIKCYGNNILSIDYSIAKDENYEFKMYTTEGEEVNSNITVNDEFLYNNGIHFETKKEGDGYRIIALDYFFQDKNNTYKNYYKIGETGEWEEYAGGLWLFDYDIVQQGLMNKEDETVTLYAKNTNDNGNEVILSNKYSVDKNASEASIQEESLLELASLEYLSSGIFKAKINGQSYGVHVYEFDKSQVWSDNVAFGIERDVATASEYAQNMVIVKVNGDLTIKSGVTVTAYASQSGYGGPKGMLIYCTGKLTNNGTISMTARGAKAEGQDVYMYKNSNGTYEYVPAIGATGGAGVYTNNSSLPGKTGESGTSRQTGGGGSGASNDAYSHSTGTSGAGGTGTSYSGGAGGAACRVKDWWMYPVTGSGSSVGGAGGSAYNNGRGGRRSW